MAFLKVCLPLHQFFLIKVRLDIRDLNVGQLWVQFFLVNLWVKKKKKKFVCGSFYLKKKRKVYYEIGNNEGKHLKCNQFPNVKYSKICKDWKLDVLPNVCSYHKQLFPVRWLRCAALHGNFISIQEAVEWKRKCMTSYFVGVLNDFDILCSKLFSVEAYKTMGNFGKLCELWLFVDVFFSILFFKEALKSKKNKN